MMQPDENPPTPPVRVRTKFVFKGAAEAKKRASEAARAKEKVKGILIFKFDSIRLELSFDWLGYRFSSVNKK